MKPTTTALSDSFIANYISRKEKLSRFFRLHPFFIKLRSWEFWPLHLVYVPVYAYYIWLSIRSKSPFFFTSTNPGIETGGLYGDSKMDILDKIPRKLIPQTCYISSDTPVDEALEQMANSKISFPIIAKPNVGERGFLVEKLESRQELSDYFGKHKGADILLQEFVTFPEEVSILYYRFPNEKRGHISSITLKEFLSVKGDGFSTLRELINAYPRARLHQETLEEKYANELDEILPRGEVKELVSIGNHARGTMFLDGTYMVDEDLVNTFDNISHQLEGIYFGRFDIKCENMNSLKAGKNFKILEINGVKAEPTHIYDPDFSLIKAYGVLFRQWKVIYRISHMNKAAGIPFMNTKEGLTKYFAWSKYKKEFSK